MNAYAPMLDEIESARRLVRLIAETPTERLDGDIGEGRTRGALDVAADALARALDHVRAGEADS